MSNVIINVNQANHHEGIFIERSINIVFPFKDNHISQRF
jgi:hypothetical protein